MSTFRLTHLAGMALLAVVVAAGTAKATKADPSVSIGAQSFGELGKPSADSSPTGNINTATTFAADALMSGTNQTGVFMGMPKQTFPFTFNPTNPTSLSFSTSEFGHFTSSSISTVSNVPGVVGIDVVGAWTPGSFSGFSALHGPLVSLFTLSFTQTPDTNGPISLSATFSSTATVIPEPPSIVLVLTGLAVGVGIYGLRRGRRPLVTV